MLFLPEAMKVEVSARSDVFIKPNIAGYGLLEFSRFMELYKLGYDTALPHLQAWLGDDNAEAQRVRHIVEHGKTLEMPDSKSHQAMMVQNEYGGREQYGFWRQSMRKVESAPPVVGATLRTEA